jgi:hypothetical protein
MMSSLRAGLQLQRNNLLIKLLLENTRQKEFYLSYPHVVGDNFLHEMVFLNITKKTISKFLNRLTAEVATCFFLQIYLFSIFILKELSEVFSALPLKGVL